MITHNEKRKLKTLPIPPMLTVIKQSKAEGRSMTNMPLAELERAIEQFLMPVTKQLPYKRLENMANLTVQGVSSSQFPVIVQMSHGLV